jgi:hypothetical protein
VGVLGQGMAVRMAGEGGPEKGKGGGRRGG